MKYILIIIGAVIFIVSFSKGIILERQLDGCHFECNHLQMKLNRCQEFSDYAEILEQLPPLVVAQLKAANKVIQQARHREYERYEQPIIIDKGRQKSLNDYLRQFHLSTRYK